MRPAESALLSNGGLISLLESAPVGHTGEQAGYELRVVHVAKPKEDLILVADIRIHANVKGIAMLIQFWRSGIICEQRIGGWEWVKIQQLDGIGIQASRRYLI